MANLTPMMRQYYRIKERYKDALLFFRVGDFYELFDEDAKIASKELGIVLTSRDKKHPMAGVPHHAVFPYIKRLIERGYTVAICEQVEDPSKAKGLVKREVVRVITPGTLIEEELLTKENNYLISIYKGCKFGIALIDVSTGEFLTTTVDSFDDVIAEILKFTPVECILPKDFENLEEIKKHIPVVHPLSEDYYKKENSLNLLEECITNLKSLELENESIIACGAALKYIKESLMVKELKFRLQKYISKEYMILDSTTLKNLEIFKNLIDNSRRGSLIEVLDKTMTAMGSRLLKRWLQRPLINVDEIDKRLEAVEELYEKSFLRQNLREILKDVYDLERIVSRIEYKKATPKDLIALKNSLKAIEEIKNFNFTSTKLNIIVEELRTLNDVVELIDRAIVEDPPLSIKDGGIIKEGFSYELDELRELKNNHEKFIKELEERERKATGIEKLKIGYNSVMGYYIEVPKSKIKFVPKHYKRKQTLANSERYTIDELESMETKILACDEKIKNLEYELFINIRDKIAERVDEIRDCALKIAELDVLSTFAEVSVLYNYKRPKVNNGYDIIIKDGRHPTVELTVDKFTPNDVTLTRDSRIILITGPNMAGKSTYLRMTALITIMAQIGCFVPAKYAVIGVVDRIFTRIGTVDDITRGYSSFMVEIAEVGQILRNATSKSLILLDEVGKSTGSRDGTSLAWAIVEYIHKIGAKTLFATHYHELAELESLLEGVKNYHFRIIEGETLEFDRKIRRGVSKESYGIKIAELVLPKEVVDRAYEIYKTLDTKVDNSLIKEIANIDTNNLTPIQALIELDRIVKKCKEMKH
ncbi:DNA mismatch repair protein MutS [Methanocaldococcus sp. 10A]